jgi:hypothetical protein
MHRLHAWLIDRPSSNQSLRVLQEWAAFCASVREELSYGFLHEVLDALDDEFGILRLPPPLE